MKKGTILLENETLDELMWGASEQDIVPNWYKISRNIQQQTSHFTFE